MQDTSKCSLDVTDKNTEIPAAEERVLLDASGCILLVCSLAAAALFSFGHDWLNLSFHGPGIGITVSHLVLTCSVICTANARKHIKLRGQGIFLLILSVLLSLTYAVFANPAMRRLNLPVLCLLTAQTLFTLTEKNHAPALSGNGLWEGLQRYGVSLFRYWKTPFQSLSEKVQTRSWSGRNLLLGIAAALIASMTAAYLLSTADQVFSSILDGAVRRAEHIRFDSVLKMLLTLLLTFMLFSHRFSLLQKPEKIHPVLCRASDPTVVSLILVGLSLVYALFSYVQIRYLFAGVESVRMSGGYAAYARSGFFQLVAVALLTLSIILPALTLFREKRAVRVLCAVTSLLTGIIDISAFVRMRLYTEAFGLSTLRVVTLWGIAMIMLALLAVLGKCIKPEFRICPVLAVIILSSWVALNWINIDRTVADNLVFRFNEGAEGSGSVQTLASDQYWNPAYYASFQNIEDPAARQDALDLLDLRAHELQADGRLLKEPSLYDWSLAFLPAGTDQQ